MNCQICEPGWKCTFTCRCGKRMCSNCSVLYGCCKNVLCINCAKHSCPLCGFDQPENITFTCELCKITNPTVVFSLNFPNTDICDSCSLVAVKCQKCNEWATDDPCIACDKK